MKHLTIEYSWSIGKLPEDQQKTIEVTTDIINLLDKYDLMFTKVNGQPKVYVDSAGGRFRQR